MVSQNLIFNISLNQKFLPVKAEADRIVESDPEFKKLLKEMESRYNKKTSQNKFQSIKVRYYIRYYLINRLKELENQNNQNVKGTETSSKEEVYSKQ